MSGFRHPGPVRSLDGDGEFTGANAPLRPLGVWTATACANASLGAGLTIGRVTCSVVTTKPAGRGRSAADQPCIETKLHRLLETQGMPQLPD